MTTDLDLDRAISLARRLSPEHPTACVSVSPAWRAGALSCTSATVSLFFDALPDAAEVLRAIALIDGEREQISYACGGRWCTSWSGLVDGVSVHVYASEPACAPATAGAA